MARSESGRSSDESSGSDDPDQSRSTPNYRQRSDDPNAADADSAFDGTQQKQFDEQDGQSDDFVNHTPAQPSKRRRLPSVSPVKRRQVAVSELDFDCVESHSFIRFPVKPQAWFECQGCALCPIWESDNSCSCVFMFSMNLLTWIHEKLCRNNAHLLFAPILWFVALLTALRSIIFFMHEIDFLLLLCWSLMCFHQCIKAECMQD